MTYTFEVTEDNESFVVTDPCYTLGTWCQGVIPNVKKGTWTTAHKMKDGVVASIKVRCLGTTAQSLPIRADFEVGVDSGQAGIFKLSEYPKGDTGEYGDETTFYGRCCEATHPKSSVMPEGFVSSSGYGDGGYVCHYWLDDNNQVIQVEIDFMISFENDSED